MPLEEASIHGSSGNAANQDSQTLKLYFDTFCDFTLFRNITNAKEQYQSESDREQIHYEKFAILLELIDMMTSDHKSLFKRLIMRTDFKETLESIFRQERLQSKAVKLMKALTEFFFQHNSQKNIYEYPMIHQSNNPRLSDQQRQMIQQQFERSSGRQRN